MCMNVHVFGYCQDTKIKKNLLKYLKNKKRNLALVAAYTAVDKGFKDYRKNVVDRFGERVDKELRYGIKAKEVEKTVTDKKR